MSRDPPQEVSSWNHTLGSLALKSNTKKTVSYPTGSTGNINRRVEGSLDSACECAHTCILPKQGGEGGLKLYRLMVGFP